MKQLCWSDLSTESVPPYLPEMRVASSRFSQSSPPPAVRTVREYRCGSVSVLLDLFQWTYRLVSAWDFRHLLFSGDLTFISNYASCVINTRYQRVFGLNKLHSVHRKIVQKKVIKMVLGPCGLCLTVYETYLTALWDFACTRFKITVPLHVVDVSVLSKNIKKIPGATQ
jgi:hypothetical protein